jgi:hypothetical protein
MSMLLAYLVMSLAQPQPVQASDQQIVRAIQNTIGKYDYVGNSLRTSMHKDATATQRAVADVERAVADVEGAVRDLCRAQPDTTSCGF